MIDDRRPTVTSPPRRSRLGMIAALVAVVVAIAAAWLAVAAGFLDYDPFHRFGAIGRRSSVGAVYFSGDMGLRFGMGPVTSNALARHGIDVVGVSSPALFATHRTRAEVDAIVANAVRRGLAQTGAKRVILIGQSYGADILQTGLAALPADLRGSVAGIILVVPGRTVFFRADPTDLSYQGSGDSVAPVTASTIDWAPLTCIYGTAESDSLCPLLRLPNQHAVALPGGHFLNRDDHALITQVFAAIARAAPGAIDLSREGRP